MGHQGRTGAFLIFTLQGTLRGSGARRLLEKIGKVVRSVKAWFDAHMPQFENAPLDVSAPELVEAGRVNEMTSEMCDAVESSVRDASGAFSSICDPCKK